MMNLNNLSEKVNYDPETDTNWCHLPVEIRMECVENMDFKTRTCLQATSKTEKAIVESAKKFEFSSIRLEFDTLFYSKKHAIEISSESDFGTYSSVEKGEYRKTISFLEQVLKMSQIECFELNHLGTDGNMGPVLEVFRRSRPVMKSVWLQCLSPSAYRNFLENCKNVETIALRFLKKFRDMNDVMQSFLNIPVVVNAKQICVVSFLTLPDLKEFLRKWIEMDAEVGKTLRIWPHSTVKYEFEDIFEIFRGRIFSQNDNKIRIRLEDKSKQVLIRIDNIIVAVVIPANLPESEENVALRRYRIR